MSKTLTALNSIDHNRHNKFTSLFEHTTLEKPLSSLETHEEVTTHRLWLFYRYLLFVFLILGIIFVVFSVQTWDEIKKAKHSTRLYQKQLDEHAKMLTTLTQELKDLNGQLESQERLTRETKTALTKTMADNERQLDGLTYELENLKLQLRQIRNAQGEITTKYKALHDNLMKLNDTGSH